MGRKIGIAARDHLWDGGRGSCEVANTWNTDVRGKRQERDQGEMYCEGVLIADARKTEPLAARGKPQGAKHKAGRSRGAPPELPVGTITRLRKPQQTHIHIS